MFGNLIVRSRDGLSEDIISIYGLNNIPEVEKQGILNTIHERLSNREVELLCGCKYVNMDVLSDNGFYYLHSKKGQQSKHDKSCYFSYSNKFKDSYNKSWKLQYLNGNYAYIPNLSNQYFKKKGYENIEARRLDENGFFDIHSKLTFRGLVAKVNVLAWDRFVLNNYRIPNSMKEFLSYLVSTLNMYYPSNSDTVNMSSYLLPSINSFKSIPNGSKKLVIGKLVGLKIIKGETLYVSDYKMLVDDAYSEQRVSLNVDGLLYSKSKEINTIPINKDNNYLVFAILRFDEGNYTVESLQLLPTTSRGLFVENQKELELFLRLEKDGALYKKEHLPLYNFGNLVPTATVIGIDKTFILNLRKVDNFYSKSKLRIMENEGIYEYIEIGEVKDFKTPK